MSRWPTRASNRLAVLAAGRRDGAGADQAAAVAEQDDLQKNRGVIRGRAGVVVAVGLDERREIELVHERTRGVLERPRHNPRFEVDGDELGFLSTERKFGIGNFSATMLLRG